jgi:peptidyl-prolyl cis-trans isomerase A (cyclophilin A)
MVVAFTLRALSWHLRAMRNRPLMILAAALVLVAACGKDEEEAVSRTKLAKSEPAAPVEGSLLSPPKEDLKAPAKYAVAFETTKGEVVVDVERELSPHGADRIYTMVKLGYFEDLAFFRVVSGFMAQVGIHGDPAVNEVWRERTIPDDPVKASNVRGAVTFAQSSMPNSRSTQIFFNFRDNSRLDRMRFAPFGTVRDMGPIDALYSGYGEGAPMGRGPAQGRVQTEGNKYLAAEFPELDYIKSARILEE